MKKIFVFAALAVTALELRAQDNVNLDSYIGAQLATEDLVGTARYVGMGGAMDALGADISTISSNPAGVGLFRHSQVSGSLGVLNQQDGKTFQDGSKTVPSFDQIGFVYSMRTNVNSFFNFGFNFHKSRNFNYVLSAANRAINGSSQNRQTTIKGIRGDLDTYWGESQTDYLYYNMIEEPDGALSTVDATGYEFDRAHTGYIGEYDINLSGNIKDRVYLGLTIGLRDVHYNAYSEYFERLNSTTMPTLTSVLMTDDHKISGTGYDVKAGIIFRPVEESPFRIGFSVASPTWYTLDSHNTTSIGDVDRCGYDAEFRFNTPWKFGLSAGHTIGREWALGFSYEYADYSTIDMRSIIGYSGYDGTAQSNTDPLQKRMAEQSLNGVSTLKLGVEFKPDPNIALRLGYNYVSPVYKSQGVRDLTLDSPGTYMSSTTDWTNWNATNRVTAGVGLTFDQVRLDVAYQYQARTGDFYPYMDNLSADYFDFDTGQRMTLSNQCDPVEVKDNRHHLTATLTYTF